jgi:uncharacterized protein YbjT (DUF2867 family)
MSNAKSKKEILVIGSKGKTGSRIFQRLTERNWPVRAGSRSADPSFDWYNDTTWAAALENIYAVYITFQPDLAAPGSADIISRFTKLAANSGVKKLVLLSGRGEPEAQECEQIVINAGLDWTIIRASWFAQNFSESFALESILAEYVELPAGNIGEPFIDVDDIADIAVAALTEEGHDGELYEVTGPRLLTFQQAVKEIGDATGRPIIYKQVTMEEYSSMLAEYQVPGEYISLLSYLFTEVLDGRNASVCDGVERALGRKATDFSEFIRKAMAAEVWSKQAVAI